jgi:hypothetical protein
MTPEPGSRGRRDNGLTATSFLSVGDVDPRVGEHLLDVLYLNGIAAYLQPTVDYDAVTRAVSLPRQPTDRLWADRRRADDARALVAAEAASADIVTGHPAPGSGAPPTTPGAAPATPGAVDEDAAWAEIVAFFHQDSASPRDPGPGPHRGSVGSTPVVPPWPAQEDLDDGPEALGPPLPPRGRRHDDVTGAGAAHDRDRAGPDQVAPRQGGTDSPGATDGAHTEWLEADPPADGTGVPALEEPEEEGYTPPPPPPLPRISKHTFGALLAIVFGLFLLTLASRVLGVDPDGALKLGILSIIGGVGYLIWRMHDGPSADERPDDGAVV